MERRTELAIRLGEARLMLLFTPALCPPERAPEELLDELLPVVDAVQVRVKCDGADASPAGELHAWTRRVLERAAECPNAPLVLVNDRPDVALALRGEGVCGVHLGTGDLPVEEARELLGEDVLLGLSTHTAAQVASAGIRGADYVGFGPVFPTATKGYTEGLGPEPAWIASQASGVPLFAIGGIDLENVSQLAEVGRVAVSSALLRAEEPARAAAALRELLEG